MSDLINVTQEKNALLLECISQVRFYVNMANKKLNLSLPMPEVRFNLRGTTAGKAWAGKNLIEFSPVLLQENPETFLEQTTGHEVGHLAARFKYGGREIKPHGNEWAGVMWTLGLPATRCHNYDLSNVPSRIGKLVHPSGNKLRRVGSVYVSHGIKVTEL